MRHAKPTLSLVPPMLNDRAFRARFTQGLDDPDGLGVFWTWYDNINDALRGQVIGPVLARLRAFLLRDFVKAVIGPAYSSFRTNIAPIHACPTKRRTDDSTSAAQQPHRTGLPAGLQRA
jgi:hypothetical protein